MDSQFATAMSRALEQTRAGNPAEATRIIQAALAGGGAPQADTVATGAAAAMPRKPLPEIEDAEVVEVHPPRQPAPGLSGLSGLKAPHMQQGDLQRMLDNLGCMVPQGLNGLPQGLPGMARTAAQPPVPEGARYETRSFASDHGTRDYRLFVPSDRDGGPKGLVLMLHGCTQNPDDFACGTGMNAQAERHGLIVVYPHQSRAHNAQGCWNWFRPEDQRAGSGEAALLAAMAQAVAAEFAVPADAVFAAGLSAGGAMAATLAATHPGVFAAVGIHSGLPHGIAHDMPSAFGAMRGQGGRAPRRTEGAVRLIVFHGMADATVHPSNAEALVAAAGPALRGTARREAGRSDGGRSYSREIVEAADGTPLVESWRIEGAGHAWSGGRPEGSYTDPAGPDASAEMVRFFLQRGK
ncbi:PHB depolymerase family esterase [Paracoccus sp. (in: a-proteobacteria)]|uniref:extracellular catalytic domain type 1 short-chain-length polyhydroxyalkanoate depolymerase n=1 Tax=Paracoccus sp. TaxID=267 RepID=UPI0026E07154|nr:PHB depolymerase family esterase [Paracoccus sp. (in: a-proteobacteria)]MDO5371602.1 PHB depolymerase family esterase [Paracoccus sp. (in: a-proteobacteria)]